MDFVENIQTSIETINTNLTELTDLEIDIGTPLYFNLLSSYDTLKKSLSTFDELITAIRTGKKPQKHSHQMEEADEEDSTQNVTQASKEEEQISTELTDDQVYRISLAEFSRPDDINNAESRIKTQEIAKAIGDMIGCNHVHLRYFYHFCPSNSTFRNIIRYLCEKIAPFVLFVTLANGQVIAIYINKKCEGTVTGEYHLRDKGMCLFGSHFENGNIVMDKYENIDGHIQITMDQHADFFEIKIEGVGKISTMPYKEMVENLFTYKVSHKPGSEKLWKGLTSPSLLCNEDLYSFVISMHVGIYRKNKFTVEKKLSTDLSQLDISFKQLIEIEDKKSLQYYINKAKTEYGLTRPSVIIDEENFPTAATNPSEPESITIASQWINLIRTREVFHLMRQKFGYSDKFTMSGVYHFTEYEMPHQFISIQAIFSCRMELCLYYFVSMECMVGVSLTKANRKDLKSNPQVMKLFAVFYKNGKAQFTQYDTKNSVVDEERRLYPYATIDDEYRIYSVPNSITLAK